MVTKLLLLQQTGWEEQELPPIPRIEIGVQVTRDNVLSRWKVNSDKLNLRPTRPVMGPKTIPKRPSNWEVVGSLACFTDFGRVYHHYFYVGTEAYALKGIAALDITGVATATGIIPWNNGSRSSKQGESKEEETDVGNVTRHAEVALNT